MIACTVCGTQNDDLSVVCSSCRSYIQEKVDNLNLFRELWGLMESPRATFRRIAMARHKNYILLLSSFLGAAFVYTGFWLKQLGPVFSDLAILVGWGILLGPPVGLIIVVVISTGVLLMGRVLGGRGKFRNAFAMIAYASSPVMYSLVFVFPIEIAVFGQYFFGSNPPPQVINPAIYFVLLGLDVIAVVWAWVLLVIGSRVTFELGRVRALLLSCCVMGVLGGTAIALRMM